MKQLSRILGAIVFVASGAAVGWLVARALEPLVHESDLRFQPPPCFEIGEPYHHRYRARCTEMMDTPRGPVSFTVNEDGLRELPRAAILRDSHRVLLLGDSYVEGWWAPEGTDLSAQLGARIPGEHFINGGLRSSGPIMQAVRLAALLPVYRPERVLWFLNDTDGADDRLACALLREPTAPAEKMAFSTEDFILAGFRAKLAALFDGTPLAHRIRAAAYASTWRELQRSAKAERCGACRGVSEVARVAREAGVPLLAVYLPAAPGGLRAVYAGEASPKAGIEKCLKEAGVREAPLALDGLSAAEQESLFWENDFHLNPEGLVAVTDRLVPEVKSWLGEKFSRRNGR